MNNVNKTPTPHHLISITESVDHRLLYSARDQKEVLNYIKDGMARALAREIVDKHSVHIERVIAPYECREHYRLELAVMSRGEYLGLKKQTVTIADLKDQVAKLKIDLDAASKEVANYREKAEKFDKVTAGLDALGLKRPDGFTLSVDF